MFDEARIEFERIKTSEPLMFAAEMACLEGTSGNQREALQILSRVTESTKQHSLASCQYAAMYASVNDKDGAFKWLEKVDSNRINIAHVRFDPQFDNLRKDSRFDDWLRRHQD